MTKPLIVHVSGDFPDPVEPAKTPVIERLIDLTADRFDHHVFSLNRRSPGPAGYLPGLSSTAACNPATMSFAYGEALTYRAPPLGVWHWRYLERLGGWLAARLQARMPRPALLVGHKLTIEGIVVSIAAARLGIPYALTLQGNTDTRVLAARPDLRARLARIFHGAAVVFSFAPWALAAVERVLGAREGACVTLPCARQEDVLLAPRAGGSGLVSAFHLVNWRTKNLDGLVAAHRTAQTVSGSTLPLAIVGGGPADTVARCQRLARGDEAITFEGPIANARMPHRLNQATAFVIPSRRESFGLVFIEALCAGAPIIYPAGRAVAGYFDGAPFALPVQPHSVREIAAAMLHARDEEVPMKAALAAWQAGPGPARFARETIARTFARGLADAIAAGDVSSPSATLRGPARRRASARAAPGRT